MSSAVTSRRNLVLQPPGKKGTVRVIAADDGGQIVSLQLVGKAAVPTVSWVRYAALPSGSTLTDTGADGGAGATAPAGGKRSASGMVGKMFGGSSAAGSGGDAGGGGSGSPAAPGGPCRVECLALGLPDVDARPTVSYAVGTTVHTLDKWGRDMGGGFSTNSTEPVRVLSAGARLAEAAGAAWATPSASQAAAGISNLFGAVTGLAAGVMSKAKGAAGGGGGGGGGAKSAAAHEAGPSEFAPPAGGSLWVGGDHIVNLFETGSGRDMSYVMCPDRVLSLVAERLVTGAPAHYDCLVGCADRTIRLVSGSAVTAEIAVDGPVAALAVLHVAPAASVLATAVAAACPGPLPPSAVGHALSGGLTVTTATGGAIYVPPSAAAAAGGAAPAPSAPAPVGAVPRYVLYGTANGMVGCVQLLHGAFTRLWAFGAAPAVAGGEVAPIAASGSIADAAVAGGGGAGDGSHSGGGGSSAGVTSIALGECDAGSSQRAWGLRTCGCGPAGPGGVRRSQRVPGWLGAAGHASLRCRGFALDTAARLLLPLLSCPRCPGPLSAPPPLPVSTASPHRLFTPRHPITRPPPLSLLRPQATSRTTPAPSCWWDVRTAPSRCTPSPSRWQAQRLPRPQRRARLGAGRGACVATAALRRTPLAAAAAAAAARFCRPSRRLHRSPPRPSSQGAPPRRWARCPACRASPRRCASATASAALRWGRWRTAAATTRWFRPSRAAWPASPSMRGRRGRRETPRAAPGLWCSAVSGAAEDGWSLV